MCTATFRLKVSLKQTIRLYADVMSAVANSLTKVCFCRAHRNMQVCTPTLCVRYAISNKNIKVDTLNC